MRARLWIGWLIVRVLCVTALVHEAAEALGDGLFLEPPVLPEDGGVLPDPLGDAVPTGPLPGLEPPPEDDPLPKPTPLPIPGEQESSAIGRSVGHARVLPDGEAAYTLPLQVPPGTNGLTPALSLEYRHRSRGGLLGAGWALGGTSVIARCPRTIAQDGRAGAVSQSLADRFCLDGQRLVVADGRSYGGAGAEYRTEIESYARIRSFGTAGKGPQYFVVEQPDGRIAEYGLTADSRIDWAGRSATPRAWALNRLRDRDGNVIDYRYTEDAAQGSFRLARLSYNGNPAAGVIPTHEVSFTYGSRPASEVDLHYVAGAAVRQVTRLDRIDVLYQGAVVRRYELGYEPSLSTAGRSRLSWVRECGRGAAACLPSTRLQWQDGAPGLGAERALTWSLGGAAWLEEGKRWWTGDVNGDGIDDLAWSGGNPATLRYRLGQRSGALGAEVNTGIAAPHGAGVPLDYDGDGAQDALMISAAGRWQIVRGGAAGLGAAFDTGFAASAIDYRGVDLDGDGLSDLAWSENLGNYGNGLVVRVRYNQPGTGFSSSPITLYEQAYYAGYASAEGGNFLGRAGRRIDLDGDGREDLLLNEEYSIARISADESVSEPFDSSFAGGVPADVNGDGCTDFAYPHYQGQWRVRFSGCRVAGPYGAEIAGPAYGVVRYAAQALDWNGDGRDDLVYADAATTWKVVRSAGDSLHPVLDSGLPHGSPTTMAVGDLDGDGLEDLVARNGTRVAYRLHTGPAPDLLLQARDGLGLLAGFRYAPLTQPGVHARGQAARYPQQDLQDGRQVVVGLSGTDGSGTGALAETGYRYGGLRRDLQGRGDLGFQVRTATPAAADGLVVEETFLQGFPFTGLGARQVTRRKDGAVLRDAAQAWKSVVVGSGAAARSRPYLATGTERLFEPGGSSGSSPYRTVQTSVGAIDATSGAVTDHSVVVTEGPGGANPGARRTARQRVLALVNDTASWCLGRPQSIRFTAGHSLDGGPDIAWQQSLAWDAPSCRVTTRVEQPGDPQLQVQTALAYDGFGNVSRAVVTGAGMTARVTTIDWGPRGRAPVRMAWPQSVAWSATWDESDGTLRSWIDENGLVTRLEHDAFGRQVAQVLPDATRSTWERQSCAAGCDPRAAYRLRERTLDSLGKPVRESWEDVDAFDRAVRRARLMPGGGWSEETAEFDAHGRLARLHRPAWSGAASSGSWRYAHDAQGRLVEASLHAPGGTVERSLRVEHDGLAIRVTDRLGRETSRLYTAWGDVAQVRQPGGAALRYDHDGFGRLLRIRDEAGRTLGEMTYDARGRKTSHKDADLGLWSFAWNALGELVSQRDAKGQSASFEYDLLGRPTRRTEPEGVTSWTWGSSPTSRNVGRLVSLAGNGYSETYTYDALSRPATRTIRSDATYEYAYGWDAAGRLASLTYPASTSGFRVKLGYDYDGEAVVGIRDLSAAGKLLWQLGATDADGNVLDEARGSAVRVVSGYSPSTGEMEYRQALSAAGVSLLDVAYRWDEAGNLVERQDHRGNVLERFTHDELDRLVAVQRNGLPDLRLRYDAAGNVRWKSDVCAGAADCYAYEPSRPHAVTTAGAGQFAYDGNGNMVRRGGSAITWYSYNQPQAIAAGGSQASFWYGPARNRWKQVATDAGVNETTVYVGGLLDKVTRAGKTTWRHYVQAPTGTAAVLLRHADGSAPRTLLLTQDHLGGTSSIVDAASGAMLLRQDFDAFGRRRHGGTTAGPSAAGWEAIKSVTRDGFTGHEHLDGVGLIHMNGRVYDPALGRFLSPDPVVQAPFDRQDLNRYAYGWNNPLRVADPSGLEEVTCLHGTHGRCQGVTVTGLREWPAISADYMALRFGSNGQVVSAAQRDPCGQDGSAEACARAGQSPTATSQPASTAPGAADYWRGFGASLGNLAMNAAPVFWLFGDDADYQWFPVPDSDAGRHGAWLGEAGTLVGGLAGTLPRSVAGATKKLLASTGGVVRRFELPDDRIFYRVFSGESTVGAWLTSVRPQSQAWAQEALALPPWNKATHVQEVFVPRGTLLERSRASQVPDWGRLRGGAEQFKLLETIPPSNFGPGSPLP